jgi:NAD(P)H-dependent FMN reductase
MKEDSMTICRTLVQWLLNECTDNSQIINKTTVTVHFVLLQVPVCNFSSAALQPSISVSFLTLINMADLMTIFTPKGSMMTR